MKPKQAYLEAARRIAQMEDTYSCIAIHNALSDEYSAGSYQNIPLAQDYKKVFGFSSIFAFQLAIEYDCETSRDFRVWLLCLAAAMQD